MQLHRLFHSSLLLLLACSLGSSHAVLTTTIATRLPNAHTLNHRAYILDYCLEPQRLLIAETLTNVSEWARVAVGVASNERTNNVFYNIRRRVTFHDWFHTQEPRARNEVRDRFRNLKAEVDRSTHLRRTRYRPGADGRVAISCDNSEDRRFCGGGGEHDVQWSVTSDVENLLFLCPAWFTAHHHRLDLDAQHSRITHLIRVLLEMKAVRGNSPQLREDDEWGRLRNAHCYEEFAMNLNFLADQYERSGRIVVPHQD